MPLRMYNPWYMYKEERVFFVSCFTAENLPLEAAGLDRSSYVSCSDVWIPKSIQCVVETALKLV